MSRSVAASSRSSRSLRVVMFHYVRDVKRTRFPRLKAASIDRFRDQVRQLSANYELATLESALAFLRNEFTPSRDLCLFTFDDGLREHYDHVLPVLADAGVQGLFFVITSCFDAKVASVHKNHFVMATLSESEYQDAILTRAAELAPECRLDVDPLILERTYRWDPPGVARVKYLLNFQLPEAARDRLLDDLFTTYLGNEAQFARELYLSWDQARDMQRHGMLIGGHSHTHVALGAMDAARQVQEVTVCAGLLHANLLPQSLWPFAYPYGQPWAFNQTTVDAVQSLDFSNAFATTVGNNTAGQDPYTIHRFDTNDVNLFRHKRWKSVADSNIRTGRTWRRT